MSVSVADSHRQDAGAGAARPRPAEVGGAARRLWRLIVLAAFAAAVAFVAGFLWFVASVPTEEVSISRPADGIVVLTGGASRIADAMELLAAGLGKRLLISGVHPATSSRELARLTPAYGRWMACCVDLGHAAINTTGNAIETKRWVSDRGFRSLIVVTSNYHMPRTMAELRRRMPEVALVPFPVVTDKMRSEDWWSSPPTAKLLFSEYLKYIVAQVRFRLGAASAAAGVSAQAPPDSRA
ncbi:MAG TPA: YdcF family protein [Xanthobacteraceae bacterium]|nr:YdcF family protein [Xanthobacteraceae bacterium]